MHILYFISVYLHMLSAMIWIGGMAFLAVVVIPVLRKPLFENSMSKIIQWTGERFRVVGWFALGTLLLTGSYNLIYRVGWSSLLKGEVWASPFGEILAYKLITVGIIFLLSAIHDFYIGPKATELWQQNGETNPARTFRKRASIFGRVNFFLGLIVVFLAIILVRGTPW